MTTQAHQHPDRPHGPDRRRSSRLPGTLMMAAALCLGSASPLFAQGTGTGTVSGRVLNAATGTYMPNVVVKVAGTNISTLTDNHGVYTLREVPAGTTALAVEYMGLDGVTETVNVGDGGNVQQDFSLGQAVRLDADGTVMLNEFVVQSDRFKNAADIAINAERQSINIKNVVSTEEFGEIPGGNVGEFIKFLPGIELDYGGTYTAPTDATGISIRGFGAEDTNIMIDGVPVSAASQASLTNQVTLDMLSINNASRIELIKVATPDMPMSSVGGQINLISKSAFEYARPSFSYKAYVVINSEEPNPFDKVAGATDKKVYAGQPGFELTYIKPINDKIGLSLTASSFGQFSANRRLQADYRTASVNYDGRPFGGVNNTPVSNANGITSLANPFLERVSITDGPRTSQTNSASMKVDWKPFDGLSVTGNYQLSMYTASDTDRRVQFRIQRPQDWGADFTHSLPYLTSAQSATGSSFNPSNSLDMTVDSRDKSGTTHSGYLKGVYRKGGWDIVALASLSRSRASFEDFQNDHFSNAELNATIGTMRFDGVKNGIPTTISVFDRNGAAFDYTDLSKWNSPTIRGRRGVAESEDEKSLYQLDVRRELDFIPTDIVNLAFKAGIRYDEENKRKWGLGTGYRETYIGPTLAVGDYRDDTYTGVSAGWGFAPQQFISTYKLYDIYQANPANFTVTASDEVENWNSYVGQNKYLNEKTEAWYAMIEGRAINDRLKFVLGLRDETKEREGAGPAGDGRWNFIKNEDGTLYRNPTLVGSTGLVRLDQANSPLFAQNDVGNALRADLNAKGITYPAAVVTAGTLARAQLERRALQPVYGKSSGDPNYSVNVAYDVTKKLVAKVAYSISSGRISIEDGVNGLLSGNHNNFRITEAESPTAFPRGTISVANPNLLPESSKNWDFELSYYTDFGGKFSASYYLKRLENFTETFIVQSGSAEFDVLMNTLGLDPASYVDWEISTTDNGIGTGKADGLEFSASQDLRFISALGDWGRNIRFFATYSTSDREETNTTRISARPTASNFGSGGVNISVNRFNLNIKGTWREDVFINGAGNFTQPDGSIVQLGNFTPEALRVDVSASYQLNSTHSLYVSARNVLEEGNNRMRYDQAGIYPEYAHRNDYRDTGVQITIGINGKF